MKSEKVKIKILPLVVTEQKSEFIEGARNELAAGPACPLKSAQTRLHSVTEQKSEFTESGRNELAPDTARPAGDSLHFLPGGKKIKVLPPSSRRQAAVHRTAAFRWFESPLTHAKNQVSKMDTWFFGDPPEIRTPDPLLKRQLLYRLS